MGHTLKTNQIAQQIDQTSLQSNIEDLLNFFENDKEKVQKILDEFFLTWSYYQGTDSGLIRDEFNKYTNAYVFLKRIVASMQIEK